MSYEREESKAEGVDKSRTRFPTPNPPDDFR